MTAGKPAEQSPIPGEATLPSVQFDVQTSLPPDRVIAMLTDFSKTRPETWPGLWEGAYEVYSVGQTSAEIREGNRSPRVWARERYDWSTPGVVRWEVVESNFCTPGGFVRVEVKSREGAVAGCGCRGAAARRVPWEPSSPLLSN